MASGLAARARGAARREKPAGGCGARNPFHRVQEPPQQHLTGDLCSQRATAPPRQGRAPSSEKESERRARPSRGSSAAFPASSLSRLLCALAGDTGRYSTLQNGARRVPRGQLEATAATTKRDPAHWPDGRASPRLWAGRSHWPRGPGAQDGAGARGQLVIKDSQGLGSNDPFQVTSAQHVPFPLCPSAPRSGAPEWFQRDRWCHFHFTNKAGAELTWDTPSPAGPGGLWPGCGSRAVGRRAPCAGLTDLILLGKNKSLLHNDPPTEECSLGQSCLRAEENPVCFPENRPRRVHEA